MSARYVWGEGSHAECKCYVCEEPPRAAPQMATITATVACPACGFEWTVVLCGDCRAASVDPDGSAHYVYPKVPVWECPCHPRN